MPVTFLTTKDGDMISKSILELSKKMDTVTEVTKNITQQYHQFAIAYERAKPLFETLTTEIETIEDIKRALEYHKSEDYKLYILQNYEIDSESNNKINKKKRSIIKTKK